MNASFLIRLKKLSPNQQKWLAEQINARKDATKKQAKSAGSLVAYFVGKEGLNESNLRQRVKEMLPPYMMPTSFVKLEELPRLPNGKINLKALPFSTPISSTSTNLDKQNLNNPSVLNAIEGKLLEIWADVLNFEMLGIHDNFFEIGGDSILSIQIIAKARKEGIIITANQIFEHQTIAELALFAKTELEKEEIESIPVGKVPLMPIQNWFFEEHKIAPHHWNQAVIFDVKDLLAQDLVKEAVHHILISQEALRLSFRIKDDIEASFLAPEKINTFKTIDLAQESETKQNERIKAISAQVHSNLKLASSGLFQCIYFKCQPIQSNKLLIIAHHLVTDSISWKIILEEFTNVCNQLIKGNLNQVSTKKSSYQKWCNHLNDLAQSNRLQEEIKFWESQKSYSDSLPTDYQVKLPVPESSIKVKRLTLGRELTKTLREEVPKSYQTRINEVLITALLQAIGKWATINSLCIGLEGHGREAIQSNLDLSNSVGWFTSYYPLSLNWQNHTNGLEDLKRIKEKLRNVPNGGIGYGILRYLKKTPSELKTLNQQPLIVFNYLGNQKFIESNLFGSARIVNEEARHPESERFYMFEINARIQDHQLHIDWHYSQNLHRDKTINTLLISFEKHLLTLIDNCLKPDGGGYTPSDFPDADLSQEDLDNLLDKLLY